MAARRAGRKPELARQVPGDVDTRTQWIWTVSVGFDTLPPSVMTSGLKFWLFWFLISKSAILLHYYAFDMAYLDHMV